MRCFRNLHEASILNVLLLSKEIGRYLAAVSPPSALVPRPVKVSRPGRWASRFQSAIAHDFTNFLTAVISYLELAMGSGVIAGSRRVRSTCMFAGAYRG